MPRTIAVTGACGTLGSAVCKLALDEGHTVIGLDVVDCNISHPNFTAKAVDTCEYQSFMEAINGCDSLVHLAALLPFKANVETPQEVCPQCSCIVHFMTVSVVRLFTMSMSYLLTMRSR